MLTPYAGERIDTASLSAFIARSYERAGWTHETVDTGAVIATGEAARKENAAAIVALFSAQSGRFVCATAGHHLESLLAAHGSGAVSLSRSPATPLVLNIDIGGGTTKLAVCRDGVVEETAALDVGARVVSWDDAGRIRTVTRAGARLAARAGVAVRPGEAIDEGARAALASAVADVALALAEGRSPATEHWLTAPIATRGPFSALVFSGGVGEYVNGNETKGFGDLGLQVGATIRDRMRGRNVSPAVESIRATCIGASQYTVQVSGDTLFITDPSLLPLRDLAAVAVHPERADASAIARSVRAGIARLDREGGAFAVAVRWSHGPAYPALRELATGIRDGAAASTPAGRPLVVVVDADVAGVVGQMLRDELAIGAPVICVDQIRLSDLDFIDVGAVIPGRAVVPVVVKSLVFSAG